MKGSLSTFFEINDELRLYTILTRNFTLGCMLYLIVLTDDEFMHMWIYKTLKDWRDDFGFITIWDKWRFDRLPYIETERKKCKGVWGTYYHLKRDMLNKAIKELAQRS